VKVVGSSCNQMMNQFGFMPFEDVPAAGFAIN